MLLPTVSSSRDNNNNNLLIYNCGELLTISKNHRCYYYGADYYEASEKLGIIKNGAVAVENGKIIAVGKTEELKPHYREVHGFGHIDADKKVVMPGFVDAHTHLIYALSGREHELELKLAGKTYMEILEAGYGILSTVEATRKTSIEKLVAESKKRLDTMLAYGTTTVEVKSGYGLELESELKILEVVNQLNRQHPTDLVPTFLGAHAIPPEYKDCADDYVNYLVESMLPTVAESNLARFVDVFCERGVFSVEQAERILSSAKNYGLLLKIHADEFSNSGGAELAAKLGAVSADHLLYVSNEGIQQLAKNSVIAVLLPAVPLSLLSHKFAPVPKFITAKVPIALGTDHNPNCMAFSMQFIITLACYYMRLHPADAIVAGTLNSAYAIGEAQRIGSLEPDKDADIIILDIENYLQIPYHIDINLVTTVIKKGKVVFNKAK